MTFQKGNPGRPRGSKNKKLELLRSNDQKLQKKVLDMAMDDDVAALKIIADRLWPRLRPESAPIRVKTNAKDLASQAEAIVQAALTGALPANVTRDLTAALADVARLKEFCELEERLQALEQSKDVPPWQRRKELSPWEEDTAELLPIRGKKRRVKK